MSETEWWELAQQMEHGLDNLSYGTGDYSIMTVALAVAYDKAGLDGAGYMQTRWHEDREVLIQQRRLIES